MLTLCDVGFTAFASAGKTAISLADKRIFITGVPVENKRHTSAHSACADNGQPSTIDCGCSSTCGKSSASNVWPRARIPFSTR